MVLYQIIHDATKSVFYHLDYRILLELNIADDYFKAKKQADSIEGELDSKDKQLYDVKHELIAAQIQVESLEKENAALQKQLNENQIKIAKLETEIEESRSKKRKTASTED